MRHWIEQVPAGSSLLSLPDAVDEEVEEKMDVKIDGTPGALLAGTNLAGTNLAGTNLAGTNLAGHRTAVVGSDGSPRHQARCT